MANPYQPQPGAMPPQVPAQQAQPVQQQLPMGQAPVPVQQQLPTPAPAPGQAPAVNTVDQAAMLAMYQQAEQEMGGGGRNFLTFDGPNGGKWSTAYTSYQADVKIWICGPWAPGMPLFVQRNSHFWKSSQFPNGTSIGCAGDGCKVCEAAQHTSGLRGGQDKATWGRKNRKWAYNVINLSDINAHIGQDGVMRPMIFEVGYTVHKRIGEIMQLKGITKVIDPMEGRALQVVKTKTGPAAMDVEYAVNDYDPSPLPAEFYPIFQNLHDLNDLVQVPTEEDQIRAVVDMGLQHPAMAGGAGAAYNPAPAMPWGNPYQTQAPVYQYQGTPAPTQYAQPTSPLVVQAGMTGQPVPGMPQYQPPAAPTAFAPMPQPAAPTQAQPQMTPPAPAAPVMPAAAGAPPPLNPPAVNTPQPDGATQYQPQPVNGGGQVAAPARTPMDAPPPAPPVPAQAPAVDPGLAQLQQELKGGS